MRADLYLLMILFPRDVKWVDSRKETSPYRASKFENPSYSLTIVTMDIGWGAQSGML